MLRLLVVLLTALSFAAGITPAQAQDVRPAGYIMAYELKGVDAEKRTVVVRKGAELAPKLLMPVYDGDSVFIRDEESRVVLSLAGEGSLIVTGKLMIHSRPFWARSNTSPSGFPGSPKAMPISAEPDSLPKARSMAFVTVSEAAPALRSSAGGGDTA